MPQEITRPDLQNAILEYIPALSWRTNPFGSHDYFNRSWLDFTGSTLERAVGGGWMASIHPEDLPGHLKTIKYNFKNCTPFESRYRLLRTDGQWRWITDFGRPAMDGEGRFTGFVGCGFDITDRIEQEQVLNEAKSRAEAAGMAKSRFLANISHEVRTPLNGIMGMLDALADSDPTEKQAAFIETASESAKQLLGVLNDVLDLARIEAGNLALYPSLLNVGELLRRGAAPFAYEARNLGITISVDIADGLEGRFFLLDEVRLRQLVFNLIGNALKFTKFGGSISICAFLAGQVPTQRLVVIVSDTGIGIPGDKLASIFDPFVQAQESLTREHGGAGLGLAIVRKLALMMRGEVCVGSEPGVGTDFVFSIPVEPGEARPILATRQTAQQITLPPLNVLLVEDDRVNQITARRMLEKLGMSVSLAMNGQEALEAVTRYNFDIVFMDVQMPVMDGLTATRAIRDMEKTWPDSRHTPIVAMTAYAMKGDRGMCLEAGMDEYVAKPLVKSDVARAARSALAANPG